MDNLVDFNKLIEVINELLPKDIQMPEEQAENLSIFLDKLNKISVAQKESQKKLKLAEDLLSTARQDLEASRNLLDKEIYNQSVFHLQQAVEKTTKALGLSLFLFDDSDFKGKNGIGHITPLAFIKMLERKWVNPYLKIIQSIYPSLKIPDTTHFKKLVRKDKAELARLDDVQLEKILQTGRKIKRAIKSKKINQKIYTKMDELFKELYPLLESHPELSDVPKRFRHYLSLDLFENFIDLYLLSIITYPHFDYTRYPDLEIKPNEYEDLGITIVSPKIFGLVESSINQITRYFEERRKDVEF